MEKIQNKKAAILKSATKLFSEHGFSNATLSQISNGAGITTSGIYNYFKSKEEILFAIIENFMRSCTIGLSEHLEGIAGAENKLRKAIWFHCKVYSTGKREIQIILESRSYPRFYNSSAYFALKDYSGLITKIIQEGMENNEIKNLSSPGLLRDMILGTVDHLALDWTINNAPSPLEFADKIFNMVMKAVTLVDEQNNGASLKQKKQKRIIDAATRLFAQNGFNDTNILAVAKEAGVAEGTVYEYYQNKENLLISIPDEKLGQLLTHVSGNGIKEKLSEIILDIFRFYNQDRDYSTILVLILRPNKRFYCSDSNQKLDNIFELMEKIIKKGQKQGIFTKDLDLNVGKSLIFGTIDHILIPWIMFKRDYDLMKVGEEVSHLFINAIRART